MLWKRLISWLAFPILCLIIASWSFSLALEGGWLRRSLEATLAASFGRPVEVGHFGFSILGSPQFEADSVTVGEDPRFGQEYFLRADRLAARLRWTALLRGRIEFDRLSLSRPSLNLVRSADGQWNVETWLPPANEQTSTAVYRGAAVLPAHATRIDIDAGRINFKRGSDKLPFALLDVSGSLSLQRAGRWYLDLEAHPMRAAVMLQSPGTLRVRGTAGGTSARLQPADLRFSWEGASLADAARLARGTDYGLRGMLDGDFAVHVGRTEVVGTSMPWKIEGGVRLQAIHRWDLVARADNPAVNVKLAGAWSPAESRLEMEHWAVEAPHSNVAGDASFDWSRGFNPDVRLLDSRIDFADLIDWGRAFFPGRVEDLDIEGNFGLEANVAGWPPRIHDVSLEGGGATLRSGGKFAPIRIGPLEVFWSRSSLVLAPVTVRLTGPSSKRGSRPIVAEAVPAGVFHLDGVLGPIPAGNALRDWPYRLTISGQTTRLQDLRGVISAFGWQFAPNWSAEGPASLQIISIGSLRTGTSSVRGELGFRNLRLSSAAINEPILVSAASVELSPGERRVQISGANALGARWNGTLEHRAATKGWTFDLSADRLDIEEVGRALGQSRQGLFYRLLPFGGVAGLTPQTEAAIARISAQGHVHISELAVATVHLADVEAAADLDRGGLLLHRAEANLYGGRVSGEFRAQLGSEPRYSFRGQVDRTDLSELAALTSVRNGFAGIASGEIDLAAHGMGRQALLDSLSGEGFLHIQDPTMDMLDLSVEAAVTGFPNIAGNRFRSSTVSFRVEDRQIRVDPWLLSGRQKQLEIVGDIDFGRRLNLQVRSNSPSEHLGSGSERISDDLWVIGGTLDAPQILREERVTAGNEAAAGR